MERGICVPRTLALARRRRQGSSVARPVSPEASQSQGPARRPGGHPSRKDNRENTPVGASLPRFPHPSLGWGWIVSRACHSAL